MARYEFEEGKSSKFWEIVLDGVSFATRYGKIGSDGQETEKTFGSPAEAKKAHDKLVAEKVKKGYLLVGDREGDEEGDDDGESPEEPRNPELDARILKSPDDVQAFLVYADWLQSKGAPRGELISVQNALLAQPDSAELKRSEKALFKKHRGALLGPLGAHEKTHDGAATDAFTWRLGFIHVARLAWDHYANEDAEDVALAEIATQLFAHPSGRFLRELTIGLNRADPDCEYQEILDAIAETAPPALSTLFVGDYENPDEIEISWAKIGNAGALWKALPGLEKLVLKGGEIALGDVDAPRLRHLELRTGGLPAEAVQSVAAGTFPELETLILWFGAEGYGAGGSLEMILPILEGKGLPKLRHLGLMNGEFADDICRVLPTSKILRQLKVLDLSMGTMTREGADALLAAAPAFAHLERLGLSSNVIGDTSGLEALGKAASFDEQRDDEGGEYRYVMVGE